MHFPWWFLVLAMLAMATPVTSLALIGTGIGWRLSRKRGRAGTARVFAWSTAIVLPFWLAGAGFGIWMIGEQVASDAEWARLNYKVKEATRVDGVNVPAGAAVSLGKDGTLYTVSLPDGVTLEAGGATWQHAVSFGAHAWVTDGSLAVDALIQGVPCQHDQVAGFWSEGQLKGCTLSRDATVVATIMARSGSAHPQDFSCRAETPIEMQLLGHGDLGACILATPTEIDGVTCAAGAEIKLVNQMLYHCTVATQTRFGPVELPPGSLVAYIGPRPEWFRLPQTGPAIDAFGFNLPAGTEAGFCYQSEALQRLTVDQTAYITIAGVKLTGAVDFDCGPFREGTLFEDSVIDGRQRPRGERISQADLSPN
ncbi:MAG: hypothetical protein JO001_06005 [Alphaproteobacteria bacterium]|nr:hypothetical protein [Alphaproteobacteria bacterium]